MGRPVRPPGRASDAVGAAAVEHAPRQEGGATPQVWRVGDGLPRLCELRGARGSPVASADARRTMGARWVRDAPELSLDLRELQRARSVRGGVPRGCRGVHPYRDQEVRRQGRPRRPCGWHRGRDQLAPYPRLHRRRGEHLLLAAQVPAPRAACRGARGATRSRDRGTERRGDARRGRGAGCRRARRARARRQVLVPTRRQRRRGPCLHNARGQAAALLGWLLQHQGDRPLHGRRARGDGGLRIDTGAHRLPRPLRAALRRAGLDAKGDRGGQGVLGLGGL